jgi:hypothetical protein
MRRQVRTLALGKLDLDDTDVTLVTSEPTISGYLLRGWRVRSFDVLRRLRAIQRFTIDGTTSTTSVAWGGRP